MFGSTIEYTLRNYTNNFSHVGGKILPDGSMHSYNKLFHPQNETFLESKLTSPAENLITTPTYPYRKMHFDEILQKYKKLGYFKNSYNILLHAVTLSDCELNILFQYYKAAFGSLNLGIEIFSNPKTFKEWNSEYTSWKDLKRWEYREWFSIFYPTWTSEWRYSTELVDDSFLKINNKEFLTNPEIWTDKIINHCHLQKTGGFAEFFDEWKSKQQYIVDKFNTIETIIASVLSDTEYYWDELTVIEEAIVQQKLRANGYELMCDGLDNFPRDSGKLKKLIYAV